MKWKPPILPGAAWPDATGPSVLMLSPTEALQAVPCSQNTSCPSPAQLLGPSTPSEAAFSPTSPLSLLLSHHFCKGQCHHVLKCSIQALCLTKVQLLFGIVEEVTYEQPLEAGPSAQPLTQHM